MYERLKALAKKIIPARILKSNEKWLRYLIALRYSGNNYECNICGFRMRQFIILDNGEKLCPRCGSLPRTRRLWMLLEEQLDGKKILHFSPPESLKNQVSKSSFSTYVTTDYEGEFAADKQLNIEQINEADNTYDLIICYHVLEHVELDQIALKELYRILRPSGECFLQTPFKKGAIYENATIITRADRLVHFGQEDHLRVYSVAGLKERVEKAGFKAEVISFEEDSFLGNRYGLKNEEIVIIAHKKN